MLRISVLWLLATAPVVLAHDLNRPDLNDWFDGLRNVGGMSCCTHSEPVVVDDWRSKNGQYEIFIKGTWQLVPNDAVVTTPNRAGRAMVWPGPPKHSGGIIIRCFMPGSMT